ncbi:hypothetical protein [Variovorax sp. RCC_210]|uniref:hypothetical protein n=1 Tax=Variovorax sp. RCC_210 TaxID=3239217 RepID=UPI003523CCE0
MSASTLKQSVARSPKPDSLPTEAEIRTEDLESTLNKPDHGTEEAEEARRQEAEPGRGENSAGFLHPTPR